MGDNARELALRAAEMVRARHAMNEATAEFSAHLYQPKLSLRLAGGPTFSAGGLSPMAHLWVSIGYRPLRWLEIETLLAGPLSPGRITAPEGKGSVFVGLAGLGPLFQLIPRARRVQLFIGAGLGVGLVNMRGEALDPLSGSSDWLASGVGYGRVALAVRLTRRLRVRVESIAGIAVPRPVVTFDDRRVAAWGRPLLSFTAGVEVTP